MKAGDTDWATSASSVSRTTTLSHFRRTNFASMCRWNQLIPQLKPGEPYNSNLVDKVLKRNKSILPADASRQDMRLTRNTKEGVVDMHFDFYSCPNMENWNSFGSPTEPWQNSQSVIPAAR